jgi:biofilm PGA synthesis N-glycosyltransferase PgaC
VSFTAQASLSWAQSAFYENGKMHSQKSRSLDFGQLGKYAVISPVRNEAQFIERTIRAMIDQTVRPIQWIIVNDCSTDETVEIVTQYAELHPWLRLVHRGQREDKGDRQRGKGIIDTFYFGYERLTSQDYEFVVKLDGDVSFETGYFEFLLRKFAANPKLGIAGGGLYDRGDGKSWRLRSSEDHVNGPAKMYRRACFEAIGGLVPALGWDGIDEWRALSLGWEVQSFSELRLLHHRVTGVATGLLKSKIEQGYGAYAMGYHPLYTIARGIRHMAFRPYVIGGLAMIFGHFVAWLEGRERLADPSVIRYVRRTQLRQLAGWVIGKRIYKGGGMVI